MDWPDEFPIKQGVPVCDACCAWAIERLYMWRSDDREFVKPMKGVQRLSESDSKAQTAVWLHEYMRLRARVENPDTLQGKFRWEAS